MDGSAFSRMDILRGWQWVLAVLVGVPFALGLLIGALVF